MKPQFQKRILVLALATCCCLDSSAGTINASFTPVVTGSNVDLTIAGKTDWVHWGLHTDTSLHRKWAVSPMINDFTVLGSGTVYIYQYSDNFNGYTWFDGGPTASQTNTITGVWAYQAFPPTLNGSGFQFTVPADNTFRTLQVFVGTFAARGQFQATLSDGGLGYSDTSLFNSGNGPGGVYTLDYQANSAGQTLTVKWTLYQRAFGSNSITGNVTLQAAALTATNANNPPLAQIVSPANQTGYAAPASIHMEALADDADGSVTEVTLLAGTNQLAQRAGPPYAFDWNNVAIGRYFLTAKARDNQGGTRTSPPVGTFVYGTGGQLTGSVAVPSGTVDLTTEGTEDWMHWGLATNTSLNRKAGVPARISNFTKLGPNPVQRFADSVTSFAWSDGTPTPSTNGTPTGIFVNGLTNGFQLTLPADTNSRTARVYVGGYGVHANFEAWLSDLSAPPYTDDSVSNVFNNVYVAYTLEYAAASAGQSLTLLFRTVNLFDFDYGNVTLQAVTLQGPPAPPSLAIVSAARLGNNFVLSFNTQTNQNYTVQYADSLPPPAWTNLVTLPGDGTILTATNYSVPPGQRCYRVQRQ